MKPNNLYSNSDKQFFLDHFIHKTDGHHQRFDQFITDFYKSLNLSPEDTPYITKDYPHKGIIKTQVQFNTHQMLWDNTSKDNLVTYFLAQPDFLIGNKSLHRLNLVHPDWNHQNNKGENALILLAKRGEIYALIKILKDFSLDPDKKDKDDKYFTHHLFNTPYTNNPKEINFNTFVRLLTQFNYINNFIDEYPEHFKISAIRLEKLSKDWQQTIDNVKNLYEQNKDGKMSLPAFNLLEEKENDILIKINQFKLIKTLERALPEKETTTAKIKI